MSLRDYQQGALDALERDWSTGLLRLGISLPTGTGKTHVMAELATNHAAPRLAYSGRVLVLVHRDTLVEQTERKMREHASHGVTVGVVKAERNVVGANIIVASAHTLRNEKRLAQLPTPDLIIVDEAHVSMSPTYERVFSCFSRARVAGFSATWVRSDKRKLGDFWQKISFQRSIRWAIRDGHLVPPRGIAVGAPEGLLDGVRTRGGDYVEGDLGEAVSVDEVRDNVIRGYHEHATGRSAVLFAPTRAAAEFFREGLNRAGIPSAGIYAGTSPKDRRRIFSAYKAKQISVLTTCTALAEGWDAPWCSVALMVRPTRHAGLYIQQVGRVLRPWPGKSDALVLDFVGGSDGMSLSLEAVLNQSEPDDEDGVDEDADDRDALPVGEQDELMFRAGKGTRPVDLFAGTGAQWLVTDQGVEFVATSTHLYFLAEVDGAWNVGFCSLDTLKNGRWLREGVSTEDALNYASIVAVDDDPTVASSKTPWRRQSKPTPGQINRARSIGCVLEPGDTRSTVADKLTIRRASVTLAPIGMRNAG